MLSKHEAGSEYVKKKKNPLEIDGFSCICYPDLDAAKKWEMMYTWPHSEDARKLPALTSSVRKMVINTTCRTKSVVLHSG